MIVVKWRILCLLQCQRQIKKLWSTEPALYCAWARTMKLFTWPSWELYLFHLLVKLEWLLRNVFYSRQSVLVGFHKDKPHGLNKHISSITLRVLINLSFLIPFLSRINVFFSCCDDSICTFLEPFLVMTTFKKKHNIYCRGNSIVCEINCFFSRKQSKQFLNWS